MNGVGFIEVTRPGVDLCLELILRVLKVPDRQEWKAVSTTKRRTESKSRTDHE